MKSTIGILAASVVFCCTQAHSQVYIQAGGGYGFPAQKQWVAIEYAATQSNETYTIINTSFGRGLNFGLNIGYMLGEQAGLEAGFSYLLGAQVVSDFSDQSVSGVTETGTDEFDLRMSRAHLGARYTIGEGSMRPYMRGGVTFGLGAKLTSGTYRSVQSSSGTSTFHSVTEYTGGSAIGTYAGLGFTYAFSDMIGIYFEANVIGQNWAPERSDIVKYDIDGTSQLSSLTTRQRETVYVDSYSDDGSAPNDNAPDEDLKMFMPASSIGLSLGVHIALGN